MLNVYIDSHWSRFRLGYSDFIWYLTSETCMSAPASAGRRRWQVDRGVLVWSWAGIPCAGAKDLAPCVLTVTKPSPVARFVPTPAVLGVGRRADPGPRTLAAWPLAPLLLQAAATDPAARRQGCSPRVLGGNARAFPPEACPRLIQRRAAFYQCCLAAEPEKLPSPRRVPLFTRIPLVWPLSASINIFASCLLQAWVRRDPCVAGSRQEH